MRIFHYALQPGGFLMLGAAETVGLHDDLFAVADKKHRLYSKKNAATAGGIVFGQGHAYSTADARRDAKPSTRQAVIPPINDINRLVLEKYAPPGVVIDSHLKILQFRGQTGTFLEPAPGDAEYSILKMARPGMLFGLRTAIDEARRSGAPARRQNLHVRDQHGKTCVADVQVIPFGEPNQRQFLVLFESHNLPGSRGKSGSKGKKNAKTARGAKAAKPDRIAHLEQELAASRDYLQSIIEDLEGANQELQSANEEILSSNEEMQSTNEELDTAREELQSTNEELNTVNEELHARNDELSRANSDLVNFLGSVQIAIVIVSADLKIRRYTPVAEKSLNLIPGDVGRSIAHIKPNIDCPDLESLITQAIDNVAPLEREVRDPQGNWFSLRIRPYKNVENKIDGAVISLFDVSKSHQDEADLRIARDLARNIIDTVRQPLLVLDGDLRIEDANRAFCSLFKLDQSSTQHRNIFDLSDRQWDIPAFRKLLEEVLPKNKRIEAYRLEHDFPVIGRKALILTARRVEAGDHAKPSILLAIDEVRDSHQ